MDIEEYTRPASAALIRPASLYLDGHYGTLALLRTRKLRGVTLFYRILKFLTVSHVTVRTNTASSN